MGTGGGGRGAMRQHQSSPGRGAWILKERAQSCRPSVRCTKNCFLLISIFMILWSPAMEALPRTCDDSFRLIQKINGSQKPLGFGFRDALRDTPGASSAACAVVRTSVGAIN